MGRVENSLLDPVIVFFLLGLAVAVGFLRSDPEAPQARRDST